MTSPLHNLVGPGKPLTAEPPDAREIEGLQRSGLARLRDAPVGTSCSSRSGTRGAWVRKYAACSTSATSSAIAEYEGQLDVSGRLVEDLIKACDTVRVGSGL